MGVTLNFVDKTLLWDRQLDPGGGGVLDQWLGIGVPLRVSNPDPV